LQHNRATKNHCRLKIRRSPCVQEMRPSTLRVQVITVATPDAASPSTKCERPLTHQTGNPVQRHAIDMSGIGLVGWPLDGNTTSFPSKMADLSCGLSYSRSHNSTTLSLTILITQISTS
jgi:hypothetical protein